MTCQHQHIQSWHFEDGTPALFWSCADCKAKFVPLQEQFDAVVKAVKHEREACAQVIDANAKQCDGFVRHILESNAAAIRARGNK